MATFNTYQQPGAETPIARKWFVWALVASLAIHAILFLTFRMTKIENLNAEQQRLVPRLFSLARVDIDEKLLKDEPEKKPQDPDSGPQAAPVIDIPQDKPTADANPQDTVFKPSAPDPVKAIASENPKVADADIKTMNKMQQSVTSDMDKELSAMSEQLIKDKGKNGKPMLPYSESKSGGPGNPGGDSGIPGMKSLDAALSNTGGGLKNGDTIGIKGGALFQFDKADLDLSSQQTVSRLQKLADLVKLYPKATLIILGYADSIGDAQYNKTLSQQRADAVKNYLTQVAKIDDARVQAIGEGSTKFIDPPTYDTAKQEQEANNRRVEIKFKIPQ